MLFWPASTDGNIFFLLLAQLDSIFSPCFNISVLLAAYTENINLLWLYFQPYHCTPIILSQVSNWLPDSKVICSSLCSRTSLEHLIHLTHLFLEPLEFNHPKFILHTRLTSYKSLIKALLSHHFFAQYHESFLIYLWKIKKSS